MRVWSLGWKDALEKELATCSSILAWRIPWTEEPGRLQSMGSQRVSHDRATNIFTFIHLREKTEFPCFTLSLLFRMNGADPFTSPYTPGILLIGEHSVCFPDVKGWRAWGQKEVWDGNRLPALTQNPQMPLPRWAHSTQELCPTEAGVVSPKRSLLTLRK